VRLEVHPSGKKKACRVVHPGRLFFRPHGGHREFGARADNPPRGSPGQRIESVFLTLKLEKK